MRSHIRAGEVPDLIRKTAEQFAGEFYGGERTPRFRLAGTEYGLTEKAYIRRYWPKFVEPAVQVLSHMLGQPGTDEAQKQQIAAAVLEYHRNSTAKPKPPLSLRRLN